MIQRHKEIVQRTFAAIGGLVNGLGYILIELGGITFETMIPYAKAGVDFISFGALTHSVKGLDMSFKAAGSDKLVIPQGK